MHRIRNGEGRSGGSGIRRTCVVHRSISCVVIGLSVFQKNGTVED